MALVVLDKTEGVATITLNRPEAMNALSKALRLELCAACQDVTNDQNIHALIVTGAGERAFTAGLDLKELGESGLGPANNRDASTNPVFALSEMPIPVIGAINGVAITGPGLGPFAETVPFHRAVARMRAQLYRTISGRRHCL